ncbi:MAG: nucleoside hydrolase [Anaerolineales bacterium]
MNGILPKRLIVDTDPGIDDAHALMLALSHPAVQVEAISTVAGNVSLEQTTRNALTVLELLGNEVPLYAGCADSLVHSPPRRAVSHGSDGLGEGNFPPPRRAPVKEHAASALVRLTRQYPGEITLVAIGPLTNLAVATRLDPELPKRVQRLVILGGVISGRGNSWLPAAEFNFYLDPEAAYVVFENWHNLLLVPWETVEKHRLSKAEVEALFAIESPKAAFFRRTLRQRFEQQVPLYGGVNEPDPLAMAIAIDQTLIQKSVTKAVTVECFGSITRGQSIVDWEGVLGKNPNAEIVLEVDQGRYVEMLKQSLCP